jgi:hypothetical protein
VESPLRGRHLHGLRKGELFGLRKTDVDLVLGMITVGRSHDRDTTKGGRAEGPLPAPPDPASGRPATRFVDRAGTILPLFADTCAPESMDGPVCIAKEGMVGTRRNQEAVVAMTDDAQRLYYAVRREGGTYGTINPCADGCALQEIDVTNRVIASQRSFGRANALPVAGPRSGLPQAAGGLPDREALRGSYRVAVATYASSSLTRSRRNPSARAGRSRRRCGLAPTSAARRDLLSSLFFSRPRRLEVGQ